ncbi:MAG: hypothetical protein V3T64_13225 [Myxococcota bacterium]
MTQDVVDQRIQITGVEHEIVFIILGEVGVPVAAQIGHDHFVSGLGKGSNISPPDAFGLRVAMHEQEWISPDSFAEEGETEVFGDFGSMDLEGIASGRFGLGRTGFRHSGSSF